jgi:hypothetical protein
LRDNRAGVNAKNALARKNPARYSLAMTSREIIDSIGRDRVAEALGVEAGRVRRALYEPQLPASWYAVLCDMAGQDLPRSAFTFKIRSDNT